MRVTKNFEVDIFSFLGQSLGISIERASVMIMCKVGVSRLLPLLCGLALREPFVREKEKQSPSLDQEPMSGKIYFFSFRED